MILADAISCVYKYNTGIMDYFVFKFYNIDDVERLKYAGTGFMYEYQKLMNPMATRNILEDKIRFYSAYSGFVRHAICTIEDLIENNEKADRVLGNKSGRIVIKDSLGQCGWNVEVLKSDRFSKPELLKYCRKRKFDLLEEFIVQHPELERLSETGLNTVRIITQLNKKNEVEILGARLRISLNNHVDNLASGNIAAPVDLETGKVSSAGVFSDITKEDVEIHPVTKTQILGFRVPFWKEVIRIAVEAAKVHPENRSIGWDIAITEEGPEFIEGNHNWCKILWQIPVKTGMKPVLEKYI